MSTDTLQQAIQFAIDHESTWDRSVHGNWGVHVNDPPPWNKLLGPVHDRGPVSGTILLGGKHLAAWGEPRRADLTFSVAKTYLALLAGIARQPGAEGLRWSALRESLGLDTATGFAALDALAHAPDDPLADAATTLAAHLLENWPQLGALVACPA